MADPNTRQGKRTPVTLKIKFKSETLEQFIERYAVDVSQGGIFIRTKEPLAVGTQMKFEFQLRDASPLIAGEGTVVWTRENDPSRPAIAPGMGVRFDRLADGSQAVLEKILAEKAKQAPARGGTAGEATTKPPMFTDTPTKVAPAPVQEALGLGGRHRAKSDSEQTPLPPPRPFHSDADDFDEKAFEEATKVRSLEELAAQTAGLSGGEASDDAPTNTAITMPPDELAKRRQTGRPDSLGEPVQPPSPTAGANVDRESAPNLPEPPPARPRADATPTPRAEDGAKTKLGVEPAKAATKAAAAAEVASTRKRPSETHPPAPSRPSAAPIIILLLVLIAGAAAAVWWFVLRENVAEKVAQPENGSAGSAGSAVATNPGSDGSAGSAGSAEIQQATTNNGSAGSAVVETPKGPTVDTVVGASVTKGVTVEIVGTDQKGPAPFTAKLEKDKAYKARVTAPGYMPTEIDVKGGEAKASAKLIMKPHMLAVTTDPPGADIYIENVNTQKITPSEVQLTAAQAAKPRVRVSLRRPGYRPVDQVVEASAFKESDSQLSSSLNAKLQVMQRPTNTGGTTTTGTGTGSATHTGAGSGAGSGSATTPTGTGTGSASTTPTGTGTGSATTTPTGTGTGSATTTTPKPPTGTGTGSATTPPPAGGAGTGSAAKPATGSATPSAATGTGATPSAATSEPAPTWTK